MPTCEEFVLECSLKEGHSINGSTCCNDYFNLDPILNQHGKLREFYYQYILVSIISENYTFYDNVLNIRFKEPVSPLTVPRYDIKWSEQEKETGWE